ncbi:NUC173-domain-containing protein [Piedraia hortae CBS 480.64]|uniref:NUC173-domain-containing protein n=1 Tax=Piedraia hortae CBS 480.64 TaxID=1314780 RepID=A0A6A7C790_9PEZI|nr:NUC173-domain-containing protein [Piedraia hortae CBS 480.64]
MSLEEKLEKIRSSPKLQNQQQTAVVLSAVEDTLRHQQNSPTPTAYFAALLSLLGQFITEDGVSNKEMAHAVVYLLDLVTGHVPPPLLRSKFAQVLPQLIPALEHPETEAPLLRACIGCVESLLDVQDAQAWSLMERDTSPRWAIQELQRLALDRRPKVRKRALEALAKVLGNLPPSPSLDHPVTDMCAEIAMQNLRNEVEEASRKKSKQKLDENQNSSDLMRALQLVKVIAATRNGWPSRKSDVLCQILLGISRGNSEFLTMIAFQVFEVLFAGMADEVSSGKLFRLLDSVKDLQPSETDTQLVPPWIAVLSRGYDVAAQTEPEETFAKLPDMINLIASFLKSPSHNIRISASECLISLLNTCVPDQVVQEPSIMDEKTLEKVAKTLQGLLSVKYQTAWMEVFNVMSTAFDVLKWQSHPLLNGVVQTIGDLRSNDSFTGKKEADAVLGAAIRAIGPDHVLDILPLNLARTVPGQHGRVWLLPLLRDYVSNTRLSHFRKELYPLSEVMFQRVLGQKEKTMETKIYETVVNQIWACLPGYCDLPLDLIEAFDHTFAEQLSNLLYQLPQLRADICRGLQNLVDSNVAVVDQEEEYVNLVSKAQARENINHLAKFTGSLLAVLFNVYSQTLPQGRGKLLQCINSYLSITPETELMESFQNVANALEKTVAGPEEKKPGSSMPPTSHALLDLIITMSVHLPRQSFGMLFNMAANFINSQTDTQLQKKAYKLIPRLSESPIGRQALKERTDELQQLLLAAGEKALPATKKDRLTAISRIIPTLPSTDLHFIPSILSEVVISTKEVNEKARTTAFVLLVSMGTRMAEGGTIDNTKTPNINATTPTTTASLQEYITMVSGGLAGDPHTISASVTCLSRLLFEFQTQLSRDTITKLVQTMDLFLTSKNREIVRSVLGFVKVCVLSLPVDLMTPRLETLIPNLITWSHEHKAHFKAKVKHIFERMIRRFGVETVEKYTPETDKKLITNIRKTRERKKRNRNKDDDGTEEIRRPRGKFESEYDEAMYASSEEDEEEESEEDEHQTKAGGRQYIIADDDEPLDLLSRKALAHVSSTKPTGKVALRDKKRDAKTDLDGKLVINEDPDEDEVMDFDNEGNLLDGKAGGGTNAYLDALNSKDAPRRGQKGRLKFGNKPARDELDEEMADEVEMKQVGKSVMRRGLGVDKRRGVTGQQRGGGIRKRGQSFRHGLQSKRGRGRR